MDTFNFGANLLILRKNKKMSQDELGAKTGVSGAQIGRYEKNKDQPSKVILLKLCAVLGVTEIEIRGLKDQENGTRERESLDAVDYKLVPLYDVMAMGGTNVKSDLAPVSEPAEWIYPGTLFKDADAVITVYGDSMWRDYPHMCRVACREVKNRNLILWGQVYAIETTEYRVVKRVRRGETKETIRGESINTVKDAAGREIHEHLEIPLNDIVRLFIVIGKVDRVQA
jgi:transcriptional regulator with XRE-family HTH domain